MRRIIMPNITSAEQNYVRKRRDTTRCTTCVVRHERERKQHEQVQHLMPDLGTGRNTWNHTAIPVFKAMLRPCQCFRTAQKFVL